MCTTQYEAKMIPVRSTDTVLLLSLNKDMQLRICDRKYDFHTLCCKISQNKSPKISIVSKGKPFRSAATFIFHYEDEILEFLQITFKNSVPLHSNYTVLHFKIPNRLFQLGKKTLFTVQNIRNSHMKFMEKLREF